MILSGLMLLYDCALVFHHSSKIPLTLSTTVIYLGGYSATNGVFTRLLNFATINMIEMPSLK